MEGTLRSPLAESAQAITDSSHVKPQPTEVASEEFLLSVEGLVAAEELDTVIVQRDELERLLATVRVLQRDLREARAKLVEAQQVLDKQSERFWDQAANALRQEEGG